MYWTILSYYFLFFCFSFLLLTEPLLGNEVTFAGTVSPSGNYKIVIVDNKSASKKCQDLFGYITRNVRTYDHKSKKVADKEIKLRPFKYNERLNLENFSECFGYFYSVQTNDKGKFKIKMSSDVKPIYVNIFPLNKQKKLIPSTFDYGYFSQNCYRYANWEDLEKQKDVLAFLHYSEQAERVNQLQNEWLQTKDVPSDEAVFLLNAYFNDITQIVSEQITTWKKMFPNNNRTFIIYGKAFLACHDKYEMNFTEKLAQIGVTKKTLKQICQFLRFDDELAVKQQIDKDVQIKLNYWNQFCPKLIGNNKMPKQSFVVMENSVESDCFTEYVEGEN